MSLEKNIKIDKPRQVTIIDTDGKSWNERYYL